MGGAHQRRLAGPLGLLLADLLLHQVLGRADGLRRAHQRDDPVTGARPEHALLGDLDGGTAEVLDLHQITAARAQDGADDVLAHLSGAHSQSQTKQETWLTRRLERHTAGD